MVDNTTNPYVSTIHKLSKTAWVLPRGRVPYGACDARRSPENEKNFLLRNYGFGMEVFGMEGLKEEDGKLLISSAKLLELLDIKSDKTLTNWRKAGCPQHSRGWWELKEVLRWRGQIQSEDAATKSGVNLQQEKLKWEVAYKEAQTEFTRMKNDIADGKYIEREFVEAELSRFFLVFKKSTAALARKLGNIIAGHVEPLEARRAEQEIADTINDALEQMSVDGVYNAKKAKRKK